MAGTLNNRFSYSDDDGNTTETDWRIEMGLKRAIARRIPSFVKKRIHLQIERMQLGNAQRAECRTDNLRCVRNLSLNDIFISQEIDRMWFDSEKKIEQFSIPDGTGGVNPGDRRAIYYLIKAFQPISVLEIGTHIGASTIHIASALNSSSNKNGQVISVDISDVNSPITKPWLKYGVPLSPIEMIDKLGYGSFVDFITDASLSYATRCQHSFDFIFLDGDHSAKTVYREIPIALNLLNENGIVLLHDYFPDMKSLWSNGSVIPGPFLAIEALKKEGLNVTVLPLGKLPWPTKLGSCVTSLALLLRNE
ncbi:MAG: O-methyltransferase [Gammaproteobacteria bacterium]